MTSAPLDRFQAVWLSAEHKALGFIDRSWSLGLRIGALFDRRANDPPLLAPRHLIIRSPRGIGAPGALEDEAIARGFGDHPGINCGELLRDLPTENCSELTVYIVAEAVALRDFVRMDVGLETARLADVTLSERFVLSARTYPAGLPDASNQEIFAQRLVRDFLSRVPRISWIPS